MSYFGLLNIKYRGAKTYSGLDFDIAKSALQKYIRRGDWMMAAKIAADMSLVSLVDDKEHAQQYVAFMNAKPNHGKDYDVLQVQRRSKAMKTNLINRLIVIASEDVSIANRDAPEVIAQLLLNNRSTLNIVKAAVYLARSPKLRILSEYKTIYLLPPYYWKSDSLKTKYINAHAELINLFPFMKATRITTWQQALHDKEVKTFFYYLGQEMLDSDSDKVLSELKSMLPVSALTRFYSKMKHAEKPLYLYHAALLFMLGKTVPQHSVLTNDIDQSFVDELDLSPYTVDDFCIDRHTGSGAGCSVTQFAMVGALVTNRDKIHFQWNMLLIYVLFKMIMDDLDSGKSITEPHIISMINSLDHKFLETILPEKTYMDSLGFPAGPQYQFIVDYYDSRGINIDLEQAASMFNSTSLSQDPVPVPVPVPVSVPQVPLKIVGKLKTADVPKGELVAKVKRVGIIKSKTSCVGDIIGHTMPMPIPIPIPTKLVGKPTKLVGVVPRPKPKPKPKALPPQEQPVNAYTDLESSLFTPIARAQIGTSHSKSDVYFAVLKVDFKQWKHGDRVVVKGPYKNNMGCQYAKALSEWKKHLGLPYIRNIECIELIPDLWSNVKGLGIRYALQQRNAPHYFMISDDLLASVDPLPTIIKESKSWEPVYVVDFAHSSIKKQYWNMVKDWPSLSNYEKMRLVGYFIVRYLAGIGDLADRNFLLIEGTVYGIDEDAPNKGVLGLPGKLLNVKRALLIRQWLSKDTNWDILEQFLNDLDDVLPPKLLVINKMILSRENITNLFS
jgi:hypothetical protein